MYVKMKVFAIIYRGIPLNSRNKIIIKNLHIPKNLTNTISKFSPTRIVRGSDYSPAYELFSRVRKKQ